MEEINKLMELEECMWNQCFKTKWSRHGDLNTKYFHYRATKRNKRNFISGLKDAQGEWIEGKDQIRELLVRYYSSIFSTSKPTNFHCLKWG